MAAASKVCACRFQCVLRLLGRRFGLRVLALASVGEKSGARAKTYVAGPSLILRRHALMQVLLIACFAMSGRAEAACTPASPVNNTIVTCTGKTTNQNGTNGYGTVNDHNNTYNIQAGATVTGDGFGVVFGTGATVNNDGTITGGIGISGSDATINNTSTGVITGDTNGIQATTATVRNAGLISAMGVAATGGNGFGISADAADVNNTSTGHITGTFSGSGTAIKLSNTADTLTLLTGSRIVGAVDMGFGNDTVNTATVAPGSKVSSPVTAAALPTFINFSGVTNTSFTGGRFSDPAMQAGNQLATLDSTALAADRPRLDGFHRRPCRRGCRAVSTAWRHPRTLRAHQGLKHPSALKGSKNDR